MNFATGTFFVFIFILFPVWPWARKENKRRWTIISIASLVFYRWFDWRFIFLLLGSAAIDFFAASKIEKDRHRKKWLIVSIVGNLGAPANFKYADFCVSQLNSMSSMLGYVLQLQYTIKSLLTKHCPQYAQTLHLYLRT